MWEIQIYSTFNYELHTISCMGPKICDLTPKEMKQFTTLNKWKVKIKIWKLGNCPCLSNLPSYCCYYYFINIVTVLYLNELALLKAHCFYINIFVIIIYVIIIWFLSLQKTFYRLYFNILRLNLKFLAL